MITSGKEVVLDVGLKQMATGINEVVVYGNSDKGRPQTYGTYKCTLFYSRRTRRYAGGIDDPARLVSAFRE